MTVMTPRFNREMNMTVVRLTPSEAAQAQRRFDQMRGAMEADGRINAHNFEVMYKSVWQQTHYGADAVEEVPEGTPMESLDSIEIPDDHECWR